MVYPLHTFLIVNLEFLVTGALVVTIGIVVFHSRGRLHWSPMRWIRLPVAFILGIGLSCGFAAWLAYINPYVRFFFLHLVHAIDRRLQIVYSSGYTVVGSFISLAFIGIYVPLAPFMSWKPVPRQKSIVLLETYIIWWILAVFNTILITKQIGGLYVITFCHCLAFSSLAVTILEYVSSQRSGAQRLASTHTVEDNGIPEGQSGSDHTETTPLIQRRSGETPMSNVPEETKQPYWALQYLILVPIPVIMVTQIALTFLGALPQTLADGGSPLLGKLIQHAASTSLISR